MKLSLLVITMLLITGATAQAATCKISMDGITALGSGPDRQAALEDAQYNCGIKRVTRHIDLRGDISEDIEDKYITDCVNAKCDKG